MKQGQDSHNVLLHRENHAFRLSDLPPAAITSVCSFWQDHRLAGGAGKIYLRAGAVYNNNPPPGKMEVHLPPLL